jgi:thiamine-monophosphate kinase
MIDVSDGLVADLGHVVAASGVCIDLDSSAFAIPDALSQVASALSVDPLTWILRGGEDHALVATFTSGVELPSGWQIVGAALVGELRPRP